MAHQYRSPAGTAGTARSRPPTAPSHPAVELQRLAGNRAVAGLIGAITVQRKGGTPKAEGVRTAEQAGALVADILTVIEQMEVGAGGPVTESSYDTSSGTKASYASRMQATLPWTIDLLRRHKELRQKFSITIAELDTAQAYMNAVSAVWSSVMALPAGTTPEQAKQDAAVTAKLGPSGLDDADLQRMLAYGNWRAQVVSGLQERAATVTALHELGAEDLAQQATPGELTAALKPANKRASAEWRKAGNKGKPPAATVADLTAAEREKLEKTIGTRQVVEPLRRAGAAAGIGAGSAKRYVAQEMAHQDNSRVDAHWGEDKAAWRRYAIEKSAPGIGAKIKQAAVDGEGMTLGQVSIADAVATISANHLDWTDDQVAWEAFRRQNGDKGYADRALKIFQGKRAAAPEPAGPK